MNEGKENVVQLRLVESPVSSAAVEVLASMDRLIAESTGGARLALALVLATRLSELATRILEEGGARAVPLPREVAGPGRMITVDEAAEMAGVTRRWIYDHTKGLRFRRDLSKKRVRLEEIGFRRWMEARKC